LNEGFPNNPDGWLKPVAETVRKAGGLLICDEVQSGFGRTGTHLWAHEKMGVVPDVVVLGKPMANGHPVGGVVAARDTVTAFRSGYRYFNTFGGNPVSCAAAMAVLNEIKEKNLVTNAMNVGDYANTRLKTLAQKYEVIGDVRGSGLIFGAELVLDRGSKAPAADFTHRIINAMRHKGIILSKLGRHKNTLKIRPPMPFSIENAGLLFDILDEVLGKTPMPT
jgi:4-aminobutyrate aminotransferase-like enzyme